MDRTTKLHTMRALLRAAAEIAADVAGQLSEASGAATHGEHLQAVGTIIDTPKDLERLSALVASVLALNTARET